MGDWAILPINREVKNRRRREEDEEDERGREEDNGKEGKQIGRR